MSSSLRRYMVCYYLATLFVLSLDSNTSGLHVNLLAGVDLHWRCRTGFNDWMLNFGCIDFTSSITANMDILGLMKNMHYISALNKQINSV